MLPGDIFRTLVFIFVLDQARGQTGSSVPNSPMWPIFSQLLSTQTGRTVQDINILGLSDPTIKQLWTSYTATLAKMTPQAQITQQTPAPITTTPPPLPDLYQTSYSFSSSNNQPINSQAASTSSSSAKTNVADNSALYSNILRLINQLSNTAPAGNTATKQTSTSSQDVLQAYSQLSASNSGPSPTQGLMEQLMASVGGSSTTGANDYQAVLNKYLAGTSTNAVQQNQLSGTSGVSAQATASASPSYQSLVDQYNSLMNQGGSGTSTLASASYEQLLQQYNQIMGSKTSGTPTSSNSGTSSGTPSSTIDQYMALLSKQGSGAGTSNDKLLQMYNQIVGGSNTSAAAPTPSPQETFEKQLATFFPQFNSLFPQSSTGNTSAASSASGDPAASNTAQMIFDALLFGPPQKAGTGTSSATSSTPAPPTETASPPPAPVSQNNPLSYIQNMVNSGAGSQAMLSNHVQNVFKTRASREMGCRFLPELLELDVLPTAPINCMNRCPFPYINSQQFGVYCVCCPPGVNEHAVGMMSLFRGNSYMETPLSVVS